MEVIPIIIFWAFALFGLFGNRALLLYLFFGSMAFGAFAVVPPTLTGGLTLTPTPMVVLLIIIRNLCSATGPYFFTVTALSPKRGLWLFLFLLVAIFATLFMPRLFHGEITIIPVRLLMFTLGEPLAPSKQNFSQLAYLGISILGVLAFARMMLDEHMRQEALKAMCLGAALAVLTGMLDYLSQYIPLSALLEPFRTASYALMTEVQIMGGKRVVGLMPEASAYGNLCLCFLCLMYFLRHAMTDRRLREQVAPGLVYLLMLFVWLSTSSSAYVGIFIFLLTAVIDWAWRKSPGAGDMFGHRGLGFEFWTAVAALAGVALVILVSPSLLDPIIEKINEMVLNKSSTSSYEERSMWTAVGWQALLDSWGMGVGLGSTRTSSFAAAVFSNTGVVGGVLFFAFVYQTLRRRLSYGADGTSVAMMRGIRFAYVPVFVVALLAATTPDFGSYNAWLFGAALALAIADARRRQQPVTYYQDGVGQPSHEFLTTQHKP